MHVYRYRKLARKRIPSVLKVVWSVKLMVRRKEAIPFARWNIVCEARLRHVFQRPSNFALVDSLCFVILVLFEWVILLGIGQLGRGIGVSH